MAIVITAFNAEHYIAACLKAALAQGYAPFEVVVIDDGSTDGTERMCRSIQDQRLRYVKKERIGRQRALNAGIALTDAEFIAINDADDLSLPHRLRYTMELFRQHQDLALVGTGFWTTEEFVEAIPRSVLAKFSDREDAAVYWPSRITLYRKNLFTHSTVMFPKRTWESIGGYDEALTLSEDYDFYLRAMQCGPVALLLGKTVLWYTNPRGGFKERSVQENLEVLRRIKRRAYALLGLPAWLLLYEPIWEAAVHMTARYPALLDLTKGFRRVTTSKPHSL
ncbi:MAG TPA: glycosyltransferase family A protein [Nitrospiraceae bacterium]